MKYVIDEASYKFLDKNIKDFLIRLDDSSYCEEEEDLPHLIDIVNFIEDTKFTLVFDEEELIYRFHRDCWRSSRWLIYYITPKYLESLESLFQFEMNYE